MGVLGKALTTIYAAKDESAGASRPGPKKPADETPKLLTVPTIPAVADEPAASELKGKKFRLDSAQEPSKSMIPKLSKLRMLHEGEQDVEDKVSLEFVPPDLFHQQALKNFLITVDRLIRFGTEQKRENLKAAYDKCHSLWDANDGKFMNEYELLKAIVKDRFKGADQAQLLELLTKYLPVHPLSGYQSHFRAPIGVALAHDYARYSHKQIKMVFCDVVNVSGTNKFFIDEMKKPMNNTLTLDDWCHHFHAEIKATDDTEEKQKELAMKLTDACVRVMTGIIKDELEIAFPNEKELLLNYGVGGDEAYFFAPDDENPDLGIPSKVKKVINETIIPKINDAITDLGLHQHPHGKDPENKPKGLGITFAGIKSLNKADLKLEEISSKAATTMYITKPEERERPPNLTEIIFKLNTTYRKYLPKPVDLKALQTMLVVAEDKRKTKTPKNVIEQQIFTMKNDATGVQDVHASASYLQAKGFKPGAFKLGFIQMKNLAAINDNVSHDKADAILREFANTLRKEILKNGNGEIFSAGGGKFICVIPSLSQKASTDLAKAAKHVIEKLNSKEVMITIDQGGKPTKVKTTIGKLESKTQGQGLQLSKLKALPYFGPFRITEVKDFINTKLALVA